MSYGKAICPVCGKEFSKKALNQIYCSKQCAQKKYNAKYGSREYRIEYIQNLRDKVFAIMGGKCVSCDESDPIVLTIDHIKPVGRNRKKLTIGVYHEILKDPIKAKEKYQLLCRNCNWRKMVKNNERQLLTLQFAYKWELEALKHQISRNASIIEALQKNKKTAIQTDDDNIEKLLYPFKSKFVNQNGDIDVNLLHIVASEELGMKLGHNRTYRIKKQLKYHHPNEFS